MTEKKVKVRPFHYVNGEMIEGPADTDKIVLGDGYLLKGNDDVVSFYVDVRESPTQRAFLVSSTQTFWTKCPVVTLESDSWANPEDEVEWTDFYFPEFPGWSVFAVHGGKTLSICLRRDECNA